MGHNRIQCNNKFRPKPISLREANGIFGRRDNYTLNHTYYSIKGEPVMEFNFAGITNQQGLGDGGADISLMHHEFFDWFINVHGYKAAKTSIGISGIGVGSNPGLSVLIPVRHRRKAAWIRFYRIESQTFQHRFLINNKALIYWGYKDSGDDVTDDLYRHIKGAVKENISSCADDDIQVVQIKFNSIYPDDADFNIDGRNILKVKDLNDFMGETKEEEQKDGLLDTNIDLSDCFIHPGDEIDEIMPEETHFWKQIDYDLPENICEINNIDFNLIHGIYAVTDESIKDCHRLDDDKGFKLKVGRNVSTKDRDSIIALCKSYRRSFAKHRWDIGKIKDGNDFEIKLKDENIFIKHKPIIMKGTKKTHMYQQLQDMSQYKLIRKGGKTSICSRAFLVKKPGEDKWRLVVDYRELNDATVKDAYPIPNINEITRRMHGCKVFSTLDIRAGYHHFKVKEEDRWKTSFITQFGMYQWNVMNFGPTNAPGHFQREMDKLLEDVDYAFPYIDDIIIASKSIEQHIYEHVPEVMKRIKDYGFKLRLDKCNFAVDTVKYLGLQISKDGIAASSQATLKILNHKKPKSKADVKSYLGLVNWLQAFVPGLAELVYPISKLRRGKEQFKWTDECDAAFEEIAGCIQNSFVLQHPDFNKRFYVQTDASSIAMGAALLQKNDAGLLVPVEFASKQFSDIESRWYVGEQEAYAVIWALEKWQQYLRHQQFTVFTDHKNLEIIFNNKQNKSKLWRWSVRVQDFDFIARFIKGSDNIVADVLSRRIDYDKVPKQLLSRYINNSETVNVNLVQAFIQDILSQDDQIPSGADDVIEVANEEITTVVEQIVSSGADDDAEVITTVVKDDILSGVDDDIQVTDENITTVVKDHLLSGADDNIRSVFYTTVGETDAFDYELDQRLDTLEDDIVNIFVSIFIPRGTKCCPEGHALSTRKSGKDTCAHCNLEIKGRVQRFNCIECKFHENVLIDESDEKYIICFKCHHKSENGYIKEKGEVLLYRDRTIDVDNQKMKEINSKKEEINKIKQHKIVQHINNKLDQKEPKEFDDNDELINEMLIYNEEQDLFSFGLNVQKINKETILKMQMDDAIIASIHMALNDDINIKQLDSWSQKEIKNQNYSINHHGIVVYKKGRILVPGKLRQATIYYYHRKYLHITGETLYVNIAEQMYWPYMREEIIDVLKHCKMCQQNKHHPHNMKGTLGKIKCTEVGEIVHVDAVGPLPVDKKGNIYSITFVDHFSGFTLSGCCDSFDAGIVIDVFFNTLFKIFD